MEVFLPQCQGWRLINRLHTHSGRRDNPYNSMPISTLRLAKFSRENSLSLANPEVTDLTQEFRTRPHKFSANLTGGSSLSRHPQFLLLVAHMPNKESQGRRVQIKTSPGLNWQASPG